MKLTELFRQSRLLKRAEYVAKEADKVGILRAGSSGTITEHGEVAGSCLRKSHLRSLGIELDAPTEDKLIMFDLGFASEDIIYEKLKQTVGEGHTILREEEIPISWFTTNGTRVTGRPDIVICKNESQIIVPSGTQVIDAWDRAILTSGLAPISVSKSVPVLGIELKSVHSVWVAREVVFNRKPKLSNLIQAAHYAWRLGVQASGPGGQALPYKLTYTNYSQLGQGMVGNDWILKQFPRPGQPLSEYVEFNPKGQIKHIRQFEIVYDIRFNDAGVLQYKLEQETDKQWTDTVVTRDGIESYFEFVSRMASDDALGPRPAQIDTLGNKAGYKDCDYCPLKATCDSHEELGYAKWLDQVKKVTSTKVSE